MRPQRNQYTDAAWYEGNLKWLLRPHGQGRIHQFIRACHKPEETVEPIVVNAHRRLGKSFLGVLILLEYCIKNPGFIAKYVCGTYEQAADIVVPIIDQILETCPEKLMPRRSGRQWIFRNPKWGRYGYSTFKLLAANFRKGNMARGPACDAAFLDEVRDFDALQYFIENVLIYQFAGRPAPLLVTTSTPPHSVDHDWTRPGSGIMPRAAAHGKYICVRGSENADFTDRDRRIILNAIPGGEASTAWRREVECEIVSDPDLLILPEFSILLSQIVVPAYERPRYFVPYVCLESGFDPDPTALLFGYIDFQNQLLIVEREHVEHRMSTRDIAAADKRICAELGYPTQAGKVKRVADIDERGLADLMKEHKLFYRPVVKYHKEAAVAFLRTKIQQNMLRIVEPTCRQLIYQCEHGIYNDQKTDYRRSDTMGHWDLGKALVYLARSISWRENPAQLEPHNPVTQFSPGSTQEPDAVLRMLGRAPQGKRAW